MEKQAAAISSPHVLIFPVPAQSTVNIMLKLAEMLCLSELHVTFLNTEYNQQRLLRHTNIATRMKQDNNQIHFETIPDGLPNDHPQLVEDLTEILMSLESVAVPFLRERLSPNTERPVTCVIAEMINHYAIDVAIDVGVPVIGFQTISPCSLWTGLCIPKLLEAKEVPFTGFVTFPTFFRGDCMKDHIFQIAANDAKEVQRVHGLIINTFEDLDRSVLSPMRSLCPNLYAIGPIHHHLNMTLSFKGTPLTSNSNSFWEEDISCMKWLDEQPSNSVIFVSIGSLVQITKDELMEIWHGLINSGVRFLWVIRLDSVQGEILDNQFINNLLHDSDPMGYIVTWAPQEKVLAHPAIGGFLTHNGWGSTMESIVEGVPMLCWPQAYDQHTTSRFVSEVWNLGVDMKDTCDRLIVEKMVKDLMETRKNEFQKSAEKMSKLATKSVIKGGSSFIEMDRLVSDIKTLSIQGMHK